MFSLICRSKGTRLEDKRREKLDQIQPEIGFRDQGMKTILGNLYHLRQPYGILDMVCTTQVKKVYQSCGGGVSKKMYPADKFSLNVNATSAE